MMLAACSTAPPSPTSPASSLPSIDSPLTAQKGDAQAGRAIVASRQNLCLLCHTAPIAEERFQGNLGPALAGVGARLSAGELRQRMVDSSKINPQSIMPAYLRSEGLQRIAPAQQGRSLLTAQQVEDVVAYLQELR
jgi:L-cysteine S-thiosulfotransferase